MNSKLRKIFESKDLVENVINFFKTEEVDNIMKMYDELNNEETMFIIDKIKEFNEKSTAKKFYDFDGVITAGVVPLDKADLVVTGRSEDEEEFIVNELQKRNVKSKFYLNPVSLEYRTTGTYKSRILSGVHKANTVNILLNGNDNIFFEDDPIQAVLIRELVNGSEDNLITVILVPKTKEY